MERESGKKNLFFKAKVKNPLGGGKNWKRKGR